MQAECPYCTCDALTCRMLKRLRFGAVGLGSVSLVFLLLMSLAKDLPLVSVARMNPMMNYARVRAEGVVEKNAYISRKNGAVDYLSFYLNDGTGSLRVSAYSAVARELTAAGKRPKKGDLLEVTGSLRVASGKRLTLRLETAGVIWK